MEEAVEAEEAAEAEEAVDPPALLQLLTQRVATTEVVEAGAAEVEEAAEAEEAVEVTLGDPCAKYDHDGPFRRLGTLPGCHLI